MKTRIYKYCFIVMTTMAANGLAAQTTTAVPFKDIHKNGASDNFTVREIKKKELQIAPSKLVTLNQPAATNRKKSLKKQKGN